MCNKSESIVNLAKAMVAFNTEMKIIEKDAKNPHFKNNYATLDTIVDEVRPLLAKHGLFIMQFPGGDGEKYTLRSMLVHESGEWIESEPLTMRPVKNDPQGIGSCTTYARRYSLSAMLSLNTGEDDDGNEASQPGKQPQQASQSYQPSKQQSAPTAPTGGVKLVTESQSKLLYNRMRAAGLGVDRLSDFLGYEVKDTKQVHFPDMNKILEWIEANAIPM